MGVRRRPSLPALNSPNPQGELKRLSLFPSQVSEEFSLSNSSLSPFSVSSSSIANQSFCNSSVLSFGESCSALEGGGESSSSVEFIKGDYCARFSGEEVRDFLKELKRLVREEEEKGALYLTPEEKRALWRVAVQGWKQIKKPSKLLRALRRLRRLPVCGSSGHLLVGVQNGEVVGFKRATHSCRSVHCPYCQVRESRKTLAKYVGWLKEQVERGIPLTFITLTVKSSHDVFEVVERLTKGFRRLYLMKIFGKRSWEQISREFARECLKYYRNLIKKGYSRAEARRRVAWQIELFRRFERATAGFSHETRFKDIFRAVWKFELTYNPDEGYHPHFHGITTLMIPKLLLTVLSRRAGLGEVCDVRAVSGKEAIVELAKYQTKYWELEGLPFEERLAVEVALLGFQKVRNWGVPEVNDGEDDVRYFALPSVRVRWNEDKRFIEKFKELHRERKEGTVRLLIDNHSSLMRVLESFEVPVRYDVVEAEGVMDSDGEVALSAGAIPMDLLRRWVGDFVEFVNTQVKYSDSFELFLLKYRPLLKAVGLEDSTEEGEEGILDWVDF